MEGERALVGGFDDDETSVLEVHAHPVTVGVVKTRVRFLFFGHVPNAGSSHRSLKKRGPTMHTAPESGESQRIPYASRGLGTDS